jgi:DegV family protein with EDD domain
MPQAKVAIVTDSTVNLPDEYLKKYSITVLPQTLIWGNETFRDTIDIQPQEFYERLGKSKNSPTTSQVTPVQFIDAYKKLIDQGYQILTITLSSDLSGTMMSAHQAKELMPDAPIELFDSRSVSLAMGFCVLAAARAAAAGASMEECKAIAKKVKESSGVFFCVDNLVFLHRGGRIGGAARFLGTALGLKPILEVREGKVEATERVRTQRKALERLLELVNQRINGQTGLRIGILEANAPEAGKFLFDEVTSRFKPAEVIQNSVTAVLGCHTGPGTVGIAYQTDI